MRPYRIRALGPVVVCLALLAAGCGGGSKSSSVASLGAAASSSGAGSGTSAFALPPGGPGIGASISRQVGTAAGVEYTACMRSHGVTNFPDPDADGTITITVSTSLDPSAPVFRRAEAQCRHLLPAEKTLSQTQQQQMKKRALAFAACMRSHGVPNYPDPKFFGSGGVAQGSGGNGMDPNSPLFQAAQKTCQASSARGG